MCVLPVLILLCDIGAYAAASICGKTMEDTDYIYFDPQNIRLMTPEPYAVVFGGIIAVLTAAAVMMAILSLVNIKGAVMKIIAVLVCAVLTAFSFLWVSFAGMHIFFETGILFHSSCELDEQGDESMLRYSADIFGTRHVQVFVVNGVRAYWADGYSAPAADEERSPKRTYTVEKDTYAIKDAVIVTITGEGRERHVRIYED